MNAVKQIQRKLDDLAKYRAQIAALGEEQERRIRLLLPKKLNAQIADIKGEIAEEIQAQELLAGKLGLEIKDLVLVHGETVQAAELEAVWQKGRETWDATALRGYAKANPEILEFRKTGNSSVAIRKLKEA